MRKLLYSIRIDVYETDPGKRFCDGSMKVHDQSYKEEMINMHKEIGNILHSKFAVQKEEVTVQ